jgi:hypothetical protein
LKSFSNKTYFFLFVILIFITKSGYAQIDSITKSFVDTVKTKLLVNDIPRKTFKDKFMYPHRWYTKQLLRPKITDFDTSYITSTKAKLTLTIPFSKKFYGFNLNDLDKNKRLNFSPNTYYHVGLNFSNVMLTFGFASAIRFGAKANKGHTRSRDLQLTVIGKRVITDVNYQNYTGFYINNFNKYIPIQSASDVIIRPDIKVISFGVNTMFIYNYKKYSLRGSFSFTDTQRKSAGSFMTGIYHSHVLFSSNDSTFVRAPFANYFSDLLKNVNKISAITVGISGGYGYTFVYKRIIFSTAINVGLGGQKTNYTTIDKKGHSQPLDFSVSFNAKAAIRYDNLKFFTGIMSTYDNNHAFNAKKFNTETYIAKVVVFVGYRFNTKKKERKLLRKMGLIDYNKK